MISIATSPGDMVWKADSTAGTWTLLTPISPNNVPSAIDATETTNRFALVHLPS